MSSVSRRLRQGEEPEGNGELQTGNHARGPLDKQRVGGDEAAAHRTLIDPFKEGFRLLALDVDSLVGEANRSVLVMSAMPLEGRSMTATNLALAFTEVADRVALIDANLTKVTPINESHDLPYEVIRPWSSTDSQKDVIDQVRAVIEYMRGIKGIVVVDAPAATTSSLGFFLAPLVGGVVYMARTKVVRDLAVTVAMRAQLDLIGAKVVGVVVNEG